MTRQETKFEEAATSMTITQWCHAEGIGKATFHKQQRDGTGPVVVKIPGSKVVRIIETRESYHKRMLARSETQAAKRAQARRVERMTRLAEISAAGPKHVSKRQRRTR